MKPRAIFFALLLLLATTFAAAQNGPFVISSASSTCASIAVSLGTTTIGIDVEGTFSLTLQPQISILGRPTGNSGVTPSAGGAAQSTITAAGYYQANVAGYGFFQLCPTAYTSGTATVYLSPGFGGNGTSSGGPTTGAVTQSGTWSVRTQDGSGNPFTTNSSTYSAKSALDANLLGTLGTAFSTAGKVDVKGADGDVFVRQATGTNLHMVEDATSLDSSTMSGTVPGTAPSNTKIIGGLFNSSNPAPTTGQGLPLQMDSQGDLEVNARPISNSGTSSISASQQATLTTSVNVKASPGSLYGLSFVNGAASVCFVEFQNSSGAGTLGTSTLVSIPLAASAVTTIMFQYPIQFSTGIAVGIGTTVNGSTACGTAGSGTVFFK